MPKTQENNRTQVSEFLEQNVRRMIKDELRTSQNKFAESIGMKPSALSAALSGSHEPGFAILQKIANGLGVTVAEILSDPSKTQVKARVVVPTALEALKIIEEELREKISAIPEEMREFQFNRYPDDFFTLLKDAEFSKIELAYYALGGKALSIQEAANFAAIKPRKKAQGLKTNSNGN